MGTVAHWVKVRSLDQLSETGHELMKLDRAQDIVELDVIVLKVLFSPR